jgi:hypothetical protein
VREADDKNSFARRRGAPLSLHQCRLRRCWVRPDPVDLGRLRYGVILVMKRALIVVMLLTATSEQPQK